jgi:hypothetical protein
MEWDSVAEVKAMDP